MSKRIIFQCDKCHKTKEQDDQPGDWCLATAAYPEPRKGGYGYHKPTEVRLWCEGCWKDIRQPHAKAEAA